MRTIAVESAPPKDHRPSAKPSATKTASLTAKCPASAESASPLPGVVEALLHFVGAHGVERTRSIARDGYGFRRAVWSYAWHRHSGRHDIAHRTASGVLSR